MTPQPGDRVTLRYRLPSGVQYVTGTVLALFTDEVESDHAVTRIPCVRIHADDPALGGPEDVWEAPVAHCRRAL